MERPESPTQLVGAFGNRVLWHRMVASVVNNMHGILKETDKERESTHATLRITRV